MSSDLRRCLCGRYLVWRAGDFKRTQSKAARRHLLAQTRTYRYNIGAVKVHTPPLPPPPLLFLPLLFLLFLPGPVLCMKLVILTVHMGGRGGGERELLLTPVLIQSLSPDSSYNAFSLSWNRTQHSTSCVVCNQVRSTKNFTSLYKSLGWDGLGWVRWSGKTVWSYRLQWCSSNIESQLHTPSHTQRNFDHNLKVMPCAPAVIRP